MQAKDYDYEALRLKTVLKEIDTQASDSKQALERAKETRLTNEKAAWEELPRAITSFDDLVEVSKQATTSKNAYEYYLLSQRMLERLERMASTPYFARVDFVPDRGQRSKSYCPIQVYIGLSSLRDSQSGDYLVYDWRAPVSSMFYDCELGKASYVAPAGVVSGELLLKRQFRIANGELLFMFDSSLQIDDEILQETLAQSKGGKLQTIVYTIQREQNRVIRNEASKVLIVQGPAGSGKTQIALHRAAYLLYKHKQTLCPEHITIFSPNRIFSDYISGVLPELGEHDVGQITFADHARNCVPEAKYIEDANDQIEYVLSRGHSPEYCARVAGIRLKASRAFLDVVKGYPDYLEKSFEFQDINYNGSLVVSKEQLSQLLHREYSYLPLFRRLDKIRRRVLWLLGPVRKKRVTEVKDQLTNDPKYAGFFESDLLAISRQKVNDEFAPIVDCISSWDLGSSWDVYRRFINDAHVACEVLKEQQATGMTHSVWDDIRNWTTKMLNVRLIPYEDVAPFLLLKGLVQGFPEQDMRHVIIDEAQDYTVAQYEVIRRAFPLASMTILGDLNQAINPYMNIGDYGNLDEVFANDRLSFIELRNSYRSTRQIAEFCQAILPGDEKAGFLDRPGSLPRVTQVGAVSDLLPQIEADIRSLSMQGFESIAIICKNAPQSAEVYRQLSRRVKDIRLMAGTDRFFQSGKVILPSYLAKGLEFDAVIIYIAEENQYSRPGEERLLYTACSRALHCLHLYYEGEISPFLPPIDSGLYEHVSCV